MLHQQAQAHSVSSTVACSVWASKLLWLQADIKGETPWEMKEKKIIHSYQLSTTLVQINFQTWSWLWLALLPPTESKTPAEREREELPREMTERHGNVWDVLHYRKCTVNQNGVLRAAYDNTPLVWADATESYYTALFLAHHTVPLSLSFTVRCKPSWKHRLML